VLLPADGPFLHRKQLNRLGMATAAVARIPSIAYDPATISLVLYDAGYQRLGAVSIRGKSDLDAEYESMQACARCVSAKL
jgi:hypothetical protein